MAITRTILRLILLACVVLGLASPALGGIRYVNASAAPGGDGLSWGTAFQTVQQALTVAASEPTEIWIAHGVYVPELETLPFTPKSKTFLLPPSTSLIGGFAGNEVSPSQRDLERFVTRLSGDVLANDSADPASLSDNVNNVVRAQGPGLRLLDGLVITGGHRFENGFNGGALCAIGASVKVSNCVLTGNQSTFGGAVLGESGAYLFFENCVVRENVAAKYGGGIYADNTTVVLADCTFERNATQSLDGGGVRIQQGMLIADGTTFRKNIAKGNGNGFGAGISAIDTALLINTCEFVGNVATASGGGIHAGGAPPVIVAQSQFTANKANGGGGCATVAGTALSFVGCEFDSNYSTSGGGGLAVSAQVMQVSACSFHDNTAVASTAGLAAGGETLWLTGCTFEDNRSANTPAFSTGFCDVHVSNTLVRGNRTGLYCVQINHVVESAPEVTFDGVHFESNHGVALYLGEVDGGVAQIRDCVFRGNLSDTPTGAGGLEVLRSADVIRCTFEGNVATQGGAVYVAFSEAIMAIRFMNCWFGGNVATANGSSSGGGAVRHMANGTSEFTNCVFTGNTAIGSGQGGAVRLGNGSAKGKFVHCAFAGNVGNGNGAGIYIANGAQATLTVHNCILWGNGGSTQAKQIFSTSSTVAIESTSVQGWTGSLGGSGNNGSDPLFVNAVGPDGIAGTPDDDLRLSVGSAAINTGSAALVPLDVFDLDGDGNVTEPLPFDLDDLFRVVGTVDRGPYEFQR